MTGPEDRFREQVAYWFFRLNGCLTITNLMLHRPRGGGAYSDVDVIAVRFPHRHELEDAHQGEMEDAPLFSSEKTDFILVEVKKHYPELNISWREKYEDQVLLEILKRIGFFPVSIVSRVARELYQKWSYEDAASRVRVFSVANVKIHEKTAEMPLPEEQQLTWCENILPFIYERMRIYWRQKSYHNQWDAQGRKLYEWVAMSENEEDFAARCLEAMGLTHNNETK